MIKIVDLFSGVGGLTFGFYYKIINDQFIKNENFKIIFANDNDKNASQAFQINFPDVPMLEMDVSNLNDEIFIEKNIDVSNIDLIIGGPPCQSYSTVGKRQYDKRAEMYKEYRRILNLIKPKMFIFENVTGILSMKDNNNKPVMEDLIKSFEELNYKISKKTLNSKNYGVPQIRKRVFIVGIKKDTNLKFNFPKKKYDDDDINLPNFLNLEDAIGDLPELKNGEKSKKYHNVPKNLYQKLMRGDSAVLIDHENSTNSVKLINIMKVLKPGESKYHLNQLVLNGELSEDYFLTSGYNNTYGKLWWDKPSTTITNNLSSPSSLRCIHPLDSRPLTSREGARIQSFPDWFTFCGTKTNKNSQIGNAVPPLLAIALADEVFKTFISDNEL